MGVECYPSCPSSQSRIGQENHQNKQSMQGMEFEVSHKTLLSWEEQYQ